MKFRIALFFLVVGSVLHAQELRQTDYEKGYIKDGARYSVWQYFNLKKEPELSINHSTGKVLFISKDTTDFVIFKNGVWVNSKLDVHPVPITGSVNYYRAIIDTLKYPLKDFNAGLEGKVVAAFEVDTLGSSSNYQILKSIRGACDSAVLASLKAVHWQWIPARVNKKKCSTMLAISFEFRLKEFIPPKESEGDKVDPKKAKLLEELVVKNPLSGKKIAIVETSAEPVGGFPAFYKWVKRNLRYPDQARRMGLEGKVFVRFIIEPTGVITNPELVAGFNVDCDREAIRLISIAPNWKPASQDGRPVRQSYTIPVPFTLEAVNPGKN